MYSFPHPVNGNKHRVSALCADLHFSDKTKPSELIRFGSFSELENGSQIQKERKKRGVDSSLESLRKFYARRLRSTYPNLDPYPTSYDRSDQCWDAVLGKTLRRLIRPAWIVMLGNTLKLIPPARGAVGWQDPTAVCKLTEARIICQVPLSQPECANSHLRWSADVH